MRERGREGVRKEGGSKEGGREGARREGGSKVEILPLGSILTVF